MVQSDTFPLPLSPAESEKSIDKKIDVPETQNKRNTASTRCEFDICYTFIFIFQILLAYCEIVFFNINQKMYIMENEIRLLAISLWDIGR